MKTPENDKPRRPFYVLFYHVVDARGTHHFLTMNSLATDMMGGRDAFEARLAQQFKSYELLGSAPVSVSENLREVTILDPRGAEQLRDRVLSAMASYPNSSRGLEPWLPDPEDSTLPPFNPKEAQWRPMSTFKKEVGKVDLERIALVFQDTDLRDVVKPEFADGAVARGGALLNELKDDIRKILEPELMRSIEDQSCGV
jgi:hypothetical protein